MIVAMGPFCLERGAHHAMIARWLKCGRPCRLVVCMLQYLTAPDAAGAGALFRVLRS